MVTFGPLTTSRQVTKCAVMSDIDLVLCLSSTQTTLAFTTSFAPPEIFHPRRHERFPSKQKSPSGIQEDDDPALHESHFRLLRRCRRSLLFATHRCHQNQVAIGQDGELQRDPSLRRHRVQHRRGAGSLERVNALRYSPHAQVRAPDGIQRHVAERVQGLGYWHLE